MKPKLNSFSVLLKYPDYVSGSEGLETYYDFVKAKTVKGAITLARKNVIKMNDLEADLADDFKVLLVTRGKHLDIKS